VGVSFIGGESRRTRRKTPMIRYARACGSYQDLMTSKLTKGTLGSVVTLLAATLYHGNPDRNHKLWNIVSSVFFSEYSGILHQ
jgi:hypothetical protein